MSRITTVIPLTVFRPDDARIAWHLDRLCGNAGIFTRQFMMSGTRVVSLVFGIWFSATIGFSAAPASAQSIRQGIPVSDSKIQVDGSVPQFFWIDSDEVLLVAIHAPAGGANAERARSRYSLVRWNSGTGSVVTVREFASDRPSVCFNQGTLLYAFRSEDGATKSYLGSIEEKKERPIEMAAANWRVCEHPAANLPSWTSGRSIVALERPGAGFVDMGPEGGSHLETAPIRLYRRAARLDQGNQLPFGRRDIRPRFPYYKFSDAYFIESSFPEYPRPKHIPYPVYWLFADGRVEKIAEIPWGPWRSRASFAPIPTKAGVVMASSNFNTRDATDLGQAGLYVFHEGRTEKLISAWVPDLRVEVSQDGCKIAFASERIVTRKSNSLKTMNLCMGSRK